MGEYNKRNVLFISDPQDDFFCFITPGLAAKYEFKYIEIGLTFLVKAVDNASQWYRGRKSIDAFFDDNENADGVRLRTH